MNVKNRNRKIFAPCLVVLNGNVLIQISICSILQKGLNVVVTVDAWPVVMAICDGLGWNPAIFVVLII